MSAQPERSEWFPRMLDVLNSVVAERARQVDQYGLNLDLRDGSGPDVPWCDPVIDASLGAGPMPASEIEEVFRDNYNGFQARTGNPTWMHLVREEVAEAFQESDPQRLEEELVQVAALCVSWVENLRRRAP